MSGVRMHVYGRRKASESHRDGADVTSRPENSGQRPRKTMGFSPSIPPKPRDLRQIGRFLPSVRPAGRPVSRACLESGAHIVRAALLPTRCVTARRIRTALEYCLHGTSKKKDGVGQVEEEEERRKLLQRGNWAMSHGTDVQLPTSHSAEEDVFVQIATSGGIQADDQDRRLMKQATTF